MLQVSVGGIVCLGMLIVCCRSHPATSLDCWREVNEFKNSVARVEQVCRVFCASHCHILTYTVKSTI